MASDGKLSTVSRSHMIYAALTAALFSTAFVASMSSEALLRDSFSMALKDGPANLQQIAKTAPVAGSEDYWLMSSVRPEGILPVTKAVSIGDKIDFAFGGRNRQFEVAAVSEFAPSVTEIDTRSGQGRFVLVTAHDAADKEAGIIRFVMEVRPPSTQVPGAQARTL